MKKFLYFMSLMLIAQSLVGQILLYENKFENPLITPVFNCGPDLDATLVNTLWGGTGTGTGGGGSFKQQWTIETLLIKGPFQQYTDPLGIGGNYTLSMLCCVQDDNLALTLNTQNLTFVNITFDLAAIDLAGCGGPFGINIPVMNVKLYNTPNGNFDFGSPGTLLDEKDLTGIAGQPYIFNWTKVQASLNSGIENNGVTLVFNLKQSGYAAFDNIRIEADNNPLPVKLSDFSASLNGKLVHLKWNTHSEINSSHFEIQKSKDGLPFQNIAQVFSKNLPNGSNYSWIDQTHIVGTDFYRLAMVDKDGSVQHSRIVKVADKIEKGVQILTNGMIFNGTNKSANIQVFNASGMLLLKRQVPPNHSTNISNLHSGLYYISANGQPTQKYFKP